MTAEKKNTLTAYKSFDANFQCRGFQYEVGATYRLEPGKPARCTDRGFHACDHPFDVWRYYPPVGDNGTLNRFGVIEAAGDVCREGADDTKFAAAEITVSLELSLPDFIKRGVDFILARASETKAETGDQSAATNTGYRSAATNTGYRSAATNTGNQSAATNTGYRSAATVEGKHSIAIATGIEGRARAGKTGAIVLAERVNDFGPDHGKLLAVWAGMVGKDGIKPDTFYTLQNGKPVEVSA